MATLKNILNKLEDFAARHYQINDYGVGDLSNISTTNLLFPLMWVEIDTANINISSTKIRFNIHILDLLKQDYTNYIDISNDTFLIGRDIISNFFDNYISNNFEAYEIASSQFREYRFDDVLCGWEFIIDIEDYRSLNTCNLPLDDYITPTPPEPFDCNLPDEDTVLSGVTYGYGDAYEGTYVCPIIPVIEYDHLQDFTGLTSYLGFAILGSLQTDAVWTITKIITNVIGDVVSSTEFTNVNWSDRYIL